MTENNVETAPENASQEANDTQDTQSPAADNGVSEQPISESTPTDHTNEEPAAESPQEPETPEWFMKDKYASIEEQAKSAFELQKKMGKFWGAPNENYDIEKIEGIPKDDPLISNLAPALKEVGLSQDGFEHLVKNYQEANVKMMKGMEEALKKELTENDAATYRAVDGWMTENLTKEEREQVKNNWLYTPQDFKLFNQLRLMAAPKTNVPNSNDANTPRFESSRAVENDKVKYRKEIKEGHRVPDKNYENELAQRFRDARARELRNNN